MNLDVAILHPLLEIGDILHTVQKPTVDVRQLVQFLNAITFFQGSSQHVDTFVRRLLEFLESRTQNMIFVLQYLQKAFFCINMLHNGKILLQIHDNQVKDQT